MIVTLLLVGSVLAQVLGVAATRASAGLHRPGWVVVAFASVSVSVGLMAQAISRGLSLAIGYGIWSGAGIALATVSGVVVFGDRLGWLQVLGLVVVAAGVLLVHGGGG